MKNYTYIIYNWSNKYLALDKEGNFKMTRIRDDALECDSMGEATCWAELAGLDHFSIDRYYDFEIDKQCLALI